MEDLHISTAIHALPSDLSRIQQARLEFAMDKLVRKYGVGDVLIAWCTAAIKRLNATNSNHIALHLSNLIRNISQIVFSQDLSVIQKYRP
jgi:hypothetical protein